MVLLTAFQDTANNALESTLEKGSRSTSMQECNAPPWHQPLSPCTHHQYHHEVDVKKARLIHGHLCWTPLKTISPVSLPKLTKHVMLSSFFAFSHSLTAPRTHHFRSIVLFSFNSMATNQSVLGRSFSISVPPHGDEAQDRSLMDNWKTSVACPLSPV